MYVVGAGGVVGGSAWTLEFPVQARGTSTLGTEQHGCRCKFPSYFPGPCHQASGAAS